MLAVAVLAITARFCPGAPRCRAAYAVIAPHLVPCFSMQHYVLNHLMLAYTWRNLAGWQDALPDFLTYVNMAISASLITLALTSRLPRWQVVVVLLLRMTVLLVGRRLRCAIMGPPIHGVSTVVPNTLTLLFALVVILRRRSVSKTPKLKAT